MAGRGVAGRPGEASSPSAPAAANHDAPELLDRLERQAMEIGRLEGRVRSLERALVAERDARRKLASTLEQKRRAAATISARANRNRGSSAAAEDELERLRRTAAAAEEQVQLTWAQLASAERRLAWKERPLWRKLLRRPPAQRSNAEPPS